MLYPRFIVTQKAGYKFCKFAAQQKKKYINARISYLPAAAAAEGGVEGGSSSSCRVFHLAGIVCQTQNFVFSHSRRRRHVRGLWIITLKTAKEREKETDKREGEREGAGGGWQLVRAAFLSHILLCRFCLHTLPLCLFLHNFLLSLVQCIFHFVLTWPALTLASPAPGQRPIPVPPPLFFSCPTLVSHFQIVVSTNLFTLLRVRAHWQVFKT